MDMCNIDTDLLVVKVKILLSLCFQETCYKGVKQEMGNFLKRTGGIALLMLLAVQLVFPAATQAFADDEKITLGTFVLRGLYANKSEKKPEWFLDYSREHEAELENKEQKISFEVTKEQADQVTSLFSDDLTPLYFSPEEFDVVIRDKRGLDKLSNLHDIGYAPYDDLPGLFNYPFSKEQLQVSYPALLEYFLKYDVATTWPHFDISTIAENGGGTSLMRIWKKS